LLAAILALLVVPAVASAREMSYDAPGARITLVRSGNELQLVDDSTGKVIVTDVLDQVSHVALRGADGVNDTLTVDLSGGPISAPVSFDGGGGSTC
jgi:hypothetical protein